MSEQSKTRPEVPDGKSRFVVTRQKEADEKGFVGYDTIWEPFHKTVEYQTPKKPLFEFYFYALLYYKRWAVCKTMPYISSNYI